MYLIIWYVLSVSATSVLTEDSSSNSSANNLENDCDANSLYRTIDGSCNNLKETSWGQAKTPLLRVLKPEYSDGVDGFPKSEYGGSLPSARDLNVNLFDLNNVPSRVYTLAAMQIGQFLAHDCAFSRSPPGERTDCCPDGVAVQSSTCASIPISTKDPFYSHYNQTCLELIRVNKDVSSPPAKPLNTVTHYMDLSVVYGSSIETTNKLRLFEDGLLKTDIVDGFEFPPCNTSDECKTPETTSYILGDVRATQNPGLLVFHILGLREHNRIARELKKLRPEFTDEKLFQESRRICIAEFQSILFCEWMPTMFGISCDDIAKNYDACVNPSIDNVFTSACFRTIHSMIVGELQFTNEKGEILGKAKLRDCFNKPYLVQKEFNGILCGMTKQASAECDKSNSPDIVNYLFAGDKPFGDDLVAIDIQRSRDHGDARGQLISYNRVRKSKGQKKASSFYDFLEVMSMANAFKLMMAYKSPADVDIYTAAQLERRCPSSVLGPTCQAVIKDQFSRLISGDRFFFTHDGQPGSFSKKQQNEFRKMTLAKLICDNGNNITSMQAKAFRLPSKYNPVVSCKALPNINITYWDWLPASDSDNQN